MKKELDEKICKKYPKIFAQRNYPMTETAMCWGFECGNGWYDLIDNLCADLQAHCDKNNVTIEVCQVKEKYGGLRFYVMGGDDHCDELINKAEQQSYNICEICGEKGELNKEDRWLMVRCDKCKEK